MKSANGFALWRLGFRPFFLFGALSGAALMALWLAVFAGRLSPLGFLGPTIWHAHEMVYGFAGAVIVGFLLTASQNWTGTRGVHGLRLQLLVAVWFAGRVLVAAAPQPSLVAACVDLAFYPLVAVFFAPYLRDRDLRVERVFLLHFGLFFAGNLLVYLDAFGVLPGFARRGVLLGLNTILLVIIFMGGRVIPFFTESSVARAQPRVRPWVEVGCHVSAWLYLGAQLLVAETVWAAGVAFAAAFFHLARIVGWQVRRVRRVPLIWVLHVAYLWLVLGFLLSGLSSLGAVFAGTAVHAFTVGALGIVIVGMMSRVSLGHTGRRLHPSAWIVAAYWCLVVASGIRVFGPLVSAGLHDASVQLSGVFWIIAFALFVAVYAPMLLSPRADGRDG